MSNFTERAAEYRAKATPLQVSQAMGKENFEEQLSKYPVIKPKDREVKCEVIDQCLGEDDDGQPVFRTSVKITEGMTTHFMSVDDFERSRRKAGKKR